MADPAQEPSASVPPSGDRVGRSLHIWTSKLKGLSLEEWSQIFSIAGVVIGLLSLAMVWRELHEHNKITRAENAQKLVELTMMSNMELIKDPQLSKLWVDGNANYDSLQNNENKERFRRIWIVYLNILESAYNQWDKGLMDEEEFASWDRDIKTHKAILTKLWPGLSGFYPPSFQRHVERILEIRSEIHKPGKIVR
jgi:hypothetical protein